MAEPKQLEQAFNFIMARLVQTGQAPHFTEIATELGLGMEEGRLVLQALFATGMPAWLFPDTDLIASVAPFSSLPNQYRITVDGQQKWFAQ
jgi:hypothetical protein